MVAFFLFLASKLDALNPVRSLEIVIAFLDEQLDVIGFANLVH